MLNQTLHDPPLKGVYDAAREAVYRDLRERADKKPLSDEARKKISAKIPPCIEHILNKQPAKTLKLNYNKLTMLLVNYFQMAGWTEEEATARVADFIQGYSHSESYNTPQKRSEHWQSMWNYLQSHQDYTFSCSHVKGLGLPGSAFECSKCVEKMETNVSKESKTISNEVKESNTEQIDEERLAIMEEGAGPFEKPNACKGISGLSLSDMKDKFSQTTEFIYKKHIVAKQSSIINGREGTGKTTICLHIGGEILKKYPDKMVYWFATEGTVADTYIKAIGLGLPDGPFQIATKGDDDFLFNFRRHQERELLDNLLSHSPRPVIAVFIDSIRGMTTQSPNDEDAGSTMRQLNSIVCDKHKAALIYLHHWNKKDTNSLLDRSTGSTAITAAVRLVLSVLPNTKYTRRLVVAKSNLAEEIPPLEVIKQGDEIVIYDANEIVDDSQVGRAEEFLMALFKKDKQLLAKDIYRMGEAEGISADVLKRTKSHIGIRAIKTSKGWTWQYPTKGAAYP